MREADNICLEVRRSLRLVSVKLSLLYFFAFFLGSTLLAQERPNIIYILADDLGYGELGAYGQSIINTPNIDRLAREGMRFTDHYSGSPVCAPSRYVLLTGQHTGHALIRGNHEWRERGDVWNYKSMLADSSLEGQFPIPKETFTLGELLQDVGYQTGLVGKWGLGAPGTEGTPNRQGFDFFFGYNCQRQAHNLYPTHLWKNEKREFLGNSLMIPHSNSLDSVDMYNEKAYADFIQPDYAPEKMIHEALSFIDTNKDKPFFLYFASPLPHLPLQAPDDLVKKYRRIIGDEEPYPGGEGYFPSQYPRATYAAMIECLDIQVGQILSKIDEAGLSENTIIMFSSDNGPTYNTGGVDPHYFNSAGPFKTGKGWGKGYVHEGGIRVPMIVKWPGVVKESTTSDHVSAFWDVLPTIADIVDYDVPNSVDGKSFLPELMGKSDQEKHSYLYWEFPSYGGQQAARMGKWKAVRKEIQQGNTSIELFDLENDPQEQYDVASDFPEVAKAMEGILTEAHTPSPMKRFQLKPIDK